MASLSAIIAKIAPVSEQVVNIFYFAINCLRRMEPITQCNLIGWNISRGTLAKIEAQVRRVTDDEVAFLAKALKVDISELYE